MSLRLRRGTDAPKTSGYVQRANLFTLIITKKVFVGDGSH